MSSRIIRGMFVCLVAVSLAVLFAACGAHEGQEDYEKGLAAYEAGDYTTAVTHFMTAAALNHPGAQCRLGICYQEGKGVTKDWVEAVRWYHEAANQKDGEAEYRLGLCYKDALGVKYDMRKQYALWAKAAKHGCVTAQVELGQLALNSYEIEFGLELLRKAAKQDNPFAMNLLGAYYETRERDHEEAEKWYLKAVESLRKAADQGDAEAQLELAGLYEAGNGVPKNTEEAAKWFRKAWESYHRDAEQGDPKKQMFLGLWYAQGLFGQEQNDAEAVKWIRMSADQGYMESQDTLGLFYHLGKHVEKDWAEAAKWYRLAAAQGSESAQRHLKKLSSPGTSEAEPETHETTFEELMEALEKLKKKK